MNRVQTDKPLPIFPRIKESNLLQLLYINKKKKKNY